MAKFDLHLPVGVSIDMPTDSHLTVTIVHLKFLNISNTSSPSLAWSLACCGLVGLLRRFTVFRDTSLLCGTLCGALSRALRRLLGLGRLFRWRVQFGCSFPCCSPCTGLDSAFRHPFLRGCFLHLVHNRSSGRNESIRRARQSSVVLASDSSRQPCGFLYQRWLWRLGLGLRFRLRFGVVCFGELRNSGVSI